jgi:hypothetical protein
MAFNQWGTFNQWGSIEPDKTKPIITLIGMPTVTITEGSTYTDLGATASDNVDGDISANIVTVNPVNPNTIGGYTITYNVSDSSGNAAEEVTRTVVVEAEAVSDTTKPVITLLGSASVTITEGDSYTDAGATALDETDGDITSGIVTVNPVDANTAGVYTVTYNASDSAGNAADEVARTVVVEAENANPTANAGTTQTVAAGATVQLDGTGSTDGDGTIVSYAWAQTGSGDAVILTGASTSTPSFTAPSTNAQQTLTFELTVTDNDAQTDTDTVDITVEAATQLIRPFINNASRNFNFKDKDGLWTDNLRVTEIDSYTMTIDPAWISPEAIINYSVTPQAGLTVVADARQDNVIQVFLQSQVVGRTSVRFDFETATRSDHVVVNLDVVS